MTSSDSSADAISSFSQFPNWKHDFSKLDFWHWLYVWNDMFPCVHVCTRCLFTIRVRLGAACKKSQHVNVYKTWSSQLSLESGRGHEYHYIQLCVYFKFDISWSKQLYLQNECRIIDGIWEGLESSVTWSVWDNGIKTRGPICRCQHLRHTRCGLGRNAICTNCTFQSIYPLAR